MYNKKIPVARVLILSSWAVPAITAAGVLVAAFLKGNLLFAAGICLLLAASVILAALLRMCANMLQMIFEIQNILQYQYREHSEMLASLSANVQSMRKEDTAAVAREMNARLLSGNVEIVESINTLAGQLQLIREGLQKPGDNSLSAVVQSLHDGVKEADLPERLRAIQEELQEIRNSCAQAACDTRDVSSFFSLMEKHLNIKQQ